MNEVEHDSKKRRVVDFIMAGTIREEQSNRLAAFECSRVHEIRTCACMGPP